LQTRGNPLRAASRLRGAEAARCPRARLCGLELAITGRSLGDERIEKLARRLCDLVHRAAERQMVCFGGARETTQFSDELQGRRTDLLVSGGRLEVVKRPDVPTHEGLAIVYCRQRSHAMALQSSYRPAVHGNDTVALFASAIPMGAFGGIGGSAEHGRDLDLPAPLENFH
jgi:hypothetical protein